MPVIPLQLGIFSSNPSRDPAAGTARIYNLYAEPGGDGAAAKSPLWPVSGLATWSTLTGGGGVRAMLATTNYLYVVAGRLLFRIDASGTATVLGGIPTDGTVTMARNRREPEPEIGIVSDGQYWVVTGATLLQNTDADLPPASSIDVLNGYFVLPGYSGVFYISDADNATNVDPADFGSAESLPDNIVRVATREGEIVLLGAESIEWWQDVGATFPFQRVSAARIGCLSAGSVAKLGRTLIWVANDYTVRQMDGYGGKMISHYAVARDIEDEADKSAITATAWAEAGHWLYAVSGTNWTWVYDLTTTKWHQRRSWGHMRWRCSHAVGFAGMTVAGDRSQGIVYRMGRDLYSEGEDPLVVEMVAPAMRAFPDFVTIDRLSLHMVTGSGAVPGNDATRSPVVMVQMSRDGGVTFGPERHLSLGTRGARSKLVEAFRWGRAQSMVFRITASAAVARGILEASVEVTKSR